MKIEVVIKKHLIPWLRLGGIVRKFLGLSGNTMKPGLCENCHIENEFQAIDRDEFSRVRCDICGTGLGGTRYEIID